MSDVPDVCSGAITPSMGSAKGLYYGKRNRGSTTNDKSFKVCVCKNIIKIKLKI